MAIVNMSDNDDLLGDDLGDHSLADYNLGNDEEDQLLADDYDVGGPQNVPPSMSSYEERVETVPQEYPQPQPQPQFTNKRKHYHLQPDTECVVPNITVEVPNVPERPSYAPYEPPMAYEEQHVPPAMPAAPIESPQIVPTETSGPGPDGEPARSRFISERPVGAQRTPLPRDIPDSLDKVVVPAGGWGAGGGGGRGGGPGGGGGGRGRTWRNPHYQPRYNHPYRRNNLHRGNFNQRPSFPPPRNMRPNSPQMMANIRPNRPPMRPEIRPDIPPNMRPDLPSNIRPERPDLPANIRPDLPPNIRPDLPPNIRPDLPPNIRPDIPNVRPNLPPNIRPDLPPNLRPDLPPDMPPIRPNLPPELRPEMPNPDIPNRPEFRPDLPRPNLPQEGFMEFRPMDHRPPFPRFQFRPDEPRPFNPNMQIRPGFEPFGYRPFRPFPPMREVVPNINQLPQVTIRHGVPGMPGNMPGNMPGAPPVKQEVRMLPVQLPPVPGGLQGKKVLINPHFKGNFQPPVEVLTGAPTYIPTRIQKTPPLSPTLENKFGPVKDIDDAAERFIAEQRNALARAANRKFPPRRSPQRFVENTTIEIENELACPPPRRRSEDEDLLRRQEEFINANRAGLRRRMRSPTPPPRRSPSPVRPRARVDTRGEPEEDSEYRRRMREQEALRDRVMRAKEVRRRKRAVANTAPATTAPDNVPTSGDRERERPREKEPRPASPQKPEKVVKPEPVKPVPEQPPEPVKPDTTRKSPEKPVEKEKERERTPVKEEEAEVNSTCEGLTPPLKPTVDSDDDLDLILGDIEGILSDDDDTGRFKEKASKPEPPKPATDLRSKLPPKASKPAEKKPPKQRIVFGEEKLREEKREEKRRRDKTPPRKTAVSSSTKVEEEKKITKSKERTPPLKDKTSKRQRITFTQKQSEKEKQDAKDKEKEKDATKTQFSNRRVILQRKVSPMEKSVFARIEVKSDPTKPNPGIFSRAVRTAIGGEKSRIVINKKQEEPQIEYESDSDDEDRLLNEEIGNIAMVSNLPHGMTDTRLKTLAGSNIQSLTLDKEERSAKITFKTTISAESFKKKFNNKMVAASRLSVTLR